jgi:hypothetical protein
MVLTRALSQDAFKHVLDNVLGKGDGTPLKSSLVNEGIEDMFSFSTLTDTMIENLTYEDSNKKGSYLKLKMGDKAMLKCFLQYIIHRDNEGNPIGDDWDKVTQSEFDSFRVNPKFIHLLAPVTSSSTVVPIKPASSTPRFTPADLFRRGIKRDPTLFPTLKDETFNDTWHRSFMNQARAQDVSEVLDAKYKATTTAEKELFHEKQKYVYAVLEAKVLTDRGKSIVREHEADFDAQKVYEKLVDHHLRSTKAMIESSTLLSYITSARLGTGEWNGTTEGFITHWLNQIRLYERQVPSTDHFSEGVKRTMLENAVSPIDELRQVKNTAALMKTNTGTVLSFESYLQLLMSAAASYDNNFKPKKTKRQVFSHEIADDDDVSYDDDHFDIDLPITTLQAFATNTGSSHPINLVNLRVFECLVINGLVLMIIKRLSGINLMIRQNPSS